MPIAESRATPRRPHGSLVVLGSGRRHGGRRAGEPPDPRDAGTAGCGTCLPLVAATLTVWPWGLAVAAGARSGLDATLLIRTRAGRMLPTDVHWTLDPVDAGSVWRRSVLPVRLDPSDPRLAVLDTQADSRAISPGIDLDGAFSTGRRLRQMVDRTRWSSRMGDGIRHSECQASIRTAQTSTAMTSATHDSNHPSAQSSAVRPAPTTAGMT